MQNAKCFELYTADGNLMFRAYVVERPVPSDPGKKETAPPAEPSGPNDDGKEKSNGELMTSPQMRKLFRLMAAKGSEGEKAHEELKKLFRASSLKEVSKLEASRMIDRLLTETKGGNGHGSSL